MKYFKNTSWLFVEKILRMVVGLFVGIWVARYLGPEQFGLFSYAQSFVALFSIIATLGLNSIVVRELVRKEIEKNILIGTSFIMMFFASLFVIGLLFIATFFTSNDTYTNILIFILASATIFQSFNVIDFYFQSKVLSKYVVYANISMLFLSSILKIVLILINASLISFVWVVLFDSIVLALGFIYFYKKNHQEFKNWKFDKKIALFLLKDSYPLIIAGVINSIYMKVDQVMIKEILDNTQVGYYAAAVKLSEVWFSVGVIICNSLFPAIINAKNISEEFYYQRIYKLFLFLVVLGYSLSVIVYFLSDYIIIFLYGKEFIEASSVLNIHIFSAIFVYLGVSSGRWLIVENKAKLDLYRNILAMLINIILNIVCIRKFGIIGAAYASLIAYIVSFYLFDIFRKDTRNIFILKTKSLVLWRIK
ncbi:flippase [Aliarcobacter cryaerophilus]|uniref:flippase n=1 Tax=Aliarcobacter cryaerophilus TaxID=28198 RepID=UPI0021B50908|nr:flippase [Aliarcobacter cryaerophilus]MCT7520525.1 flippase [Aliarcobacter cryaerophilus]